MLRLAINGYGRIGRSILRSLYESPLRHELSIVAINELADAGTILHLTRYDSTHGRFPKSLEGDANQLWVDGDAITLLNHSEIDDLPWGKLGVDVVLECTGASCSTNGILPLIKALDDAVGIENGTITTIHSAMNDQPVLDAYHHTDLRKTRAAAQSIIPVDTELARGIERLLPDMVGRFSAQALRVPTLNVSALDLTVQTRRDTDVIEINQILRDAALSDFSGVLGYTEELLASCDFNHDSRSSIVDASQTRISGKRLVKVLTWFDNEWGYANRMLDVAKFWGGL